MITRPLITIQAALVLCCLQFSVASAGFFGFGDDNKGKSGLDFNRGYDVNTVATVSGRATAPPYQGEGDQVVVEISDGTRSVKVAVGPRSYWESKGIAIRANDEITAKGARAQGQDGREYLLSQKLVNRTTGRQLEMRSDRGEPAWGGGGGARMGSLRSSGGHMFQGGGLLHGGGGMMRH